MLSECMHCNGSLQDGVWVGIEWDDPSRGKHDGMAGGVRYFESTHPTGASFVRIEKVNTGVGILAALAARYKAQQARGTSCTVLPLKYRDAVQGMFTFGPRFCAHVLLCCVTTPHNA